MNTNSNSYTLIFAAVLVTLVAGLLAFTATSLKPIQDNNIRNEKMQSILASMGVETSREDAGETFKTYIKEQLALKADGSVDTEVNAFTINMKNEIKKDPQQQRFPIYVGDNAGKKIYILPLFGKGLWDDIWGYIALGDDKNTIVGAVFDHKGETPGLGAEIREGWFQEQFIGKKIFDKEGDFTASNFVSVRTVKGGAKAGDTHGVDAISGGTVTSDKLSNMVKERLQRYLPYLEKN
jgi:Na+-transporting NADH:ubiquinone oxidoreductase subunit C